MWSPPVVSKPKNNPNAKGDFYDCLKNVSCDVLLVFGKDDPWCKPSFAKNMLLALEERNSNSGCHHAYVEITNAGHCPNHESPKAVSHLVNLWVDRGTTQSTPLRFVEEWGDMKVQE